MEGPTKGNTVKASMKKKAIKPRAQRKERSTSQGSSSEARRARLSNEAGVLGTMPRIAKRYVLTGFGTNETDEDTGGVFVEGAVPIFEYLRDEADGNEYHLRVSDEGRSPTDYRVVVVQTGGRCSTISVTREVEHSIHDVLGLARREHQQGPSSC
jgi:hypothetical protein